MSESAATRAGMDAVLQATCDPTWLLEAGERAHIHESSCETRFAISNGFLGVRGALAVNRDGRWAVPPRTYVAGLFDTPDKDGPVSVLVPAADWLQLGFSIVRAGVDHPVVISAYKSTLDMRRGVVLVNCRIEIEPDLAVRIKTLRLVSMRERALGLQLIQFEIECGEEDVTIEASFGGLNLGLTPCVSEGDVRVWRARASGKSLAMCASPTLQLDAEDIAATKSGPFRSTWSWKTAPGQVACFQRLVAFQRSETPDVDPAEGARAILHHAQSAGWTDVVADHVSEWKQRWACSDVQIDSDGIEQQAVRFAIYHLNSAANPQDDRVSVGARALTGDDYHGHVFWDTEIYLLPFYTLTWPEAARAMLMYRFHTLDAARDKATRRGWRGALYAWESADTGVETTPAQAVAVDRKIVKILCGTQEQHISADVAYAIWRYWLATGDDDFLFDAGAEIIIETGRFWASRAGLEADGLYHIRSVIGPDEYHETIDDNAFTNVMARWNLRRALDVVAIMRERRSNLWTSLARRLTIDDAEIARWGQVAAAMATGLDIKTGLFEQFDGFSALEDIDLATYEGRSVPMDVVLGRERVARSKVIKQADVVALLALLPDEFAGDAGAINFRHYEPLCAHGSSLSRAMHGIAAAKLGNTEKALAYFRETSSIDLGDKHVAIAGGLHIAALGGIWQIVVLGFAGLELLADGVGLRPQLPSSWRNLVFAVTWHGRQLSIRIEQAQHMVEARLEAGEPMSVTLSGVTHQLVAGMPLRASFQVEHGRSPSSVIARRERRASSAPNT